MKNFKKGDWCFCEFNLQQINKVEDGKVKEVTDGMFTMSGGDLSDVCYPLDVHIKRISDEAAYWSREFHAMKHTSLNHPDLNRELIRRWAEMCDNKDDTKTLTNIYTELSVFGKAVVDKVRDAKYEEVSGVKIFR